MMKYQQLLDLQVFTMQDVYDKIGNINTSKKLINKMLLDKNIKKVKHNLYVVCDLQYKQPIPNQYMIASKIKEDSYICYHSAMEFHGVKNQIFYTVYVASNKRFNDFQFEGYLYSHINSKFSFGIERKIKSLKIGREYRIPKSCIIEYLLSEGNEPINTEIPNNLS